MLRSISIASALIAAARAQQACTSTSETHPPLTWSKCTSSGCSEVKGSVVVDANWRWTHTVEGSQNCYNGNKWDESICTDGATCAEKCCVDGADYANTYGVTTSGDQLSLDFVTKGAYATNVGSRLYLMEDDETYQMFDLLGNEFTFDVDVSAISCGLNGALYFVSMDEDGGKAKYDGNNAGAKYGTGYCDAQCARDVKFINGKANSDDWVPSKSDPNSGKGGLGSCCPEMDIWEANDMSTAFTPHPCTDLTQHQCEGDDCGGTFSETRYAGTCDPDGCDFNPFRQGNETFYGPGSEFTVDTTKKMTVVTQFVKGSSGLSEIKRLYVQNGKVVANAQSAVKGNEGNSITPEFCSAQKTAFGDDDDFTAKGGWSGMSDALAAPMVLVMSLWDDHYANMLWLDSTYPIDETAVGAKRGSCATDSGVPKDVEASVPNSKVTFSNIKFGPIGSTFEGGDASSSDDTVVKPTTAAQTSPKATTVVQKASSAVGSVEEPETSVVAPEPTQAETTAVIDEPVTSAVDPVEQPEPTQAETSVAAEQPATSAIIEEPATSAIVSQQPSASATKATASAVKPSPTDSELPDDEYDDQDDSDCEDDGTDSSSDLVALYQRCGGIGHQGSTKCADGAVCKEWNEWYSQCISE